MKQGLIYFTITLALGLGLSTHAMLVSQWDFNNRDLAATTGTALAYRGDTAATTSFTTATIGGQTAYVMRFPATTPSQGYIMTHGLGPNGGGSRVNQYTLIMDIMFPTASSGQWRSLFQTDPANVSDGDLFVNPGNGIGISGEYAGVILANTWQRVAFVVDLTAPTDKLRKFIDGVQVGTQDSGYYLDGRWALEPTALLFADENNETRMGYVNSIQIRSEAMLAADIAALGGASAAGIPLPVPPTALHVISPNGGESFQAGTSQAVSWTVANPNGLAQIDLYRGGVFFQNIAQIALSESNYLWAIHPALGDANNYRIKLTTSSNPEVTDSSDGDFSVFGSTGAINPLFGQQLQTNGGFELLFSNWQTVAGKPIVATSANGKNSPHGGANFVHGGINTTASQSIIRQDIDLIAAGFKPDDLDTGAALDAEAWLRTLYVAGTFDDQVFYRIGYLDEAGQELSSVRCMIVADNKWLQRNLSGLLPAGTRILRLEVVGNHRRDADNDSMADDLIVRLQKPFPLPTPRITKLPMLQDVRTNAMKLIWETDGNLACHFVDWGRSNIMEHTISQIETLQIDTSHFVHRATLPGLETETSYVYRVRSGTTATPAYAFKTAPGSSSSFVTAWWGDNHGATDILARHVTNLLAHAPNLICVVGDMVNSGNSISEWHDYWFKPLETLNAAQTTPVLFARGNHDGEYALPYAYSSLPGNEAWFAFDYGNSRFIFLDSEASTSASIEQYNWLQAELSRPETQQAAFRIVCFHRPPYVNLWNGGGYTGEGWVENDWVPLFTRKNVDLVIGGHMHAYQRGLTNGVMYVVTGGGGGALDTERVAHWPFVQAEYSQYHFGMMEVNGPALSWSACNSDNQLLDAFKLQSRVPVLGWKTTAPVGNVFALTLSGKPGTRYVLEGSTDLTGWTAFATNTIPANATATLTNLIPANSIFRFIRARTSQ
jgi:hypothetical protein